MKHGQQQGIPPVILYAVGAVIVYVLLHALDKGWKSQKKRRMQQKLCGDHTPTIFVLMYAYKDNYAAASTIRHMLLSALCPSSISFGVVQSVTESSKDVYGLYKEASAYDPYISTNVRVKTFYSGSHPTTLEAFDIALSQLYRNEEYVMITSPGTIFAAQFDIQLVKNHRSISKKSKNVVLTSHGKKFTMGKMKPSVTPNILSYMAATFPCEQVEVDQTTWFPCYQSYQHVPTIYPRAAPNTQTKPLPVIACSVICSFFKGPPSFDYGTEDAWDASFFLSNALHRQNYHFYAPPCTVAFPRTASSKYMVQRNIGNGSYGTYCNYAGVDQTTYRCSSRARLGLMENFSSREITQKYGSDENYQVARTTTL